MRGWILETTRTSTPTLLLVKATRRRLQDMVLFARYAGSPGTPSQPIQSFAPQGQPTKKPKRGPSATRTVHFEVNLNESDEGRVEDSPSSKEGSDSEVEEEGEPDEFFDVLDILDGRAEPLSDEEPLAGPSLEKQVPHASSGEDEEEDEADDDGDDQDMDLGPGDQLVPSEDEADVDALQNLGQFISNLDSSTKRKTSEDGGTAVTEDNVPRKKRKLLKERNEAGAENEFAASGKLEFDLCGIPLYSDNCALQVTLNSISRIFSLRLQASPTTWTP